MWEFDELHGALAETPLAALAEPLAGTSRSVLSGRAHGDRARWLAAIEALPEIPVAAVQLQEDAVCAAATRPPDAGTMARLRRSMQALHPWRKGPFDLFGMVIDAEWRSCMKWSRVAPHLSPLDGRVVLDVGSGNGYYLYRMLGAGAAAAIGVDPTELFVAQFQALNRYLGASRAVVLPLRCEDLPASMTGMGTAGFDTVFSMGVYYHRRDPLAHLGELAELLRPGGELVLETLVIEGDGARALEPGGRYARMRNVWTVPSLPLLTAHLLESGFIAPRLVGVTPTTAAEQRSTTWMTFESLADCLDPADATRTVEGYPAPVRACIIATRELPAASSNAS